MMPPFFAPEPRQIANTWSSEGARENCARQHLEEDVRAALRRLPAQHGEFFGQLRDVRAIIAEVADLDMPRPELFGGVEQQRAGGVRGSSAVIGAIPVQQPFDFQTGVMPLLSRMRFISWKL